jgi:archaellum biogenesis protein FlaJ (TadC family)
MNKEETIYTLLIVMPILVFTSIVLHVFIGGEFYIAMSYLFLLVYMMVSIYAIVFINLNKEEDRKRKEGILKENEN